MLRLVACGTAGALALAWTYAPSLAGANGSGIGIQGVNRDYGNGGGGGIGGAGLVAGAGVGAAAIAYAVGAFGGGAGAGAGAAGAAFAIGSAAEARERAPALPDGHTVTEIRLYPAQSVLEPGLCRAISIEGRSSQDKKWYSITFRDGVRLEVEEGEGCLMLQEGSKNILCLPMTAPQSCNGRSVVVRASLPGSNGELTTGEARIQLRVPGTGSVRLIPGGAVLQ
jgi:hypothetical protein